MTAVHFTRNATGGFTVRFAYDPTLVDLLKATVAPFDRAWNPDDRAWTVAGAAAATLAQALRDMGVTVTGLAGPRTDSAAWAQVLFQRVGPARTTAVYRCLSRVLHPDTPTGDTALQQELNAAHEALSKQGRR